jgi:hypothetical protein
MKMKMKMGVNDPRFFYTISFDSIKVYVNELPCLSRDFLMISIKESKSADLLNTWQPSDHESIRVESTPAL